MSTETDRLSAIQDELNGILEERITDLLAQMKALREVTSQISATELDIRRQEALRRELEKQVQPLEHRAGELQKENSEIQGKVDSLRENVERMRKMREDLVSNLSGLTGSIK